MHMYMTAALRKTDVKAIGLQMALDLIHKKEKRDLITGLKTRTQAGRPDWDKVLCMAGIGVNLLKQKTGTKSKIGGFQSKVGQC